VRGWGGEDVGGGGCGGLQHPKHAPVISGCGWLQWTPNQFSQQKLMGVFVNLYISHNKSEGGPYIFRLQCPLVKSHSWHGGNLQSDWEHEVVLQPLNTGGDRVANFWTNESLTYTCIYIYCQHWLSSPFSCSALLDMESGQLTVTTDVMSLPPPCTWSWLQALCVQSLRCLTQGEHLSKTWESNLPKWGHCSKCDGSVCWSDLLMSKLVNCSPATLIVYHVWVRWQGYVYVLASFPGARKKIERTAWYPLFAHAWLPRFRFF